VPDPAKLIEHPEDAANGNGQETIPAGSCIPYSGNFSALQVIEQTPSAVVGISFYNSATQ
jgi:hypothetical protein